MIRGFIFFCFTFLASAQITTIPQSSSAVASSLPAAGTIPATGATHNNCLYVDSSGNVNNQACATSPTTNQNIRTIGATFTNSGSALSGTSTACAYLAFAGTIQQVTIIADQSGNATIDVKTVSYSSYTGPGSASSITAAAIPAISAAAKYKDTTLTGWTTSISADTVVCFALSSPATVTNAVVQLKIAAN